MEFNTTYFDKQIADISKIAVSVSAKPQSFIDDLINFISGVRDEIIRRVTDAINTIIKPIRDTLNFVFYTIVSGFNYLLDTIEDVINSIGNAIWTLIDRLTSLIGDIINTIRTYLQGVVNVLYGVMQTIATSIANAINVIRDTLYNVIRWAVERISEVMTNIIGGIQNVISNIGRKIEELANSIIYTVQGVLSSIQTTITNLLNTMLERIAYILNELTKAIERIYQNIVDYVNRNVITPINTSLGQGKAIVEFKANVLYKAAMGEYKTLGAFLDDLSDPPPVIGAIGGILGGLLMASALIPAASQALSPAFKNLTYLVNEQFRPEILTANDYVIASYRGIIDDATCRNRLAKLGLGDTEQNILKQLNTQTLTPSQIGELYVRGVINESEHDTRLLQLGFTNDVIARLKVLYNVLPTPSDLIRMAVREVFTPDIAQRFGLFEDYPKEITQYGKQLGISEEWLKRYWGAHWELPSLSMGYEMLHRGIITEDDLKMLMRAQDVMPYWRDKLIKLSYNPLTRVDIRRMYSTGVIDEKQVYRAYLDLGYDPIKAKWLTEFTKQEYSPDEETDADKRRKLTAQQIVKAYMLGLLTRDDALHKIQELRYSEKDADTLLTSAQIDDILDAREKRLRRYQNDVEGLLETLYIEKVLGRDRIVEHYKSVGYNDDEINTLLDLYDARKEIRQRKEYINTIENLYVSGAIDKNDAIQLLSKVNPSGEELDGLFGIWELRQLGKRRLLTEAQYTKAYKMRLISESEYVDYLSRLGYGDNEIELLLKMNKQKTTD